jgi:hypothetical protein
LQDCTFINLPASHIARLIRKEVAGYVSAFISI